VFALRCLALLGKGGFLSGTYGVGLGGVQVGAHDALLLNLREDGFGVRVGECGGHLGGCGCVFGMEVSVLDVEWEWKGCEGGWNEEAYVLEGKGQSGSMSACHVNVTGPKPFRAHVCL
jgi:hypothetical protein